MSENGITHVTMALYHLSSNGRLKEQCKLSNMDLKQQRETHYKSDSLISSLPITSPLIRPWALPQLNYNEPSTQVTF